LNYFLRPRYQDDNVPIFLKCLGRKYDGLYKCVFCHDLTYSCIVIFVGLCSAAGPGIPDIVAQALNFIIIKDNKHFLLNGTRCAVPVRLPSSLCSASFVLEYPS
jgi:hypothetical protein